MPDRFVLVLAGGRGERFWPWSQPQRPKQLLPLAGDGRSLIASTLDRALRVAPADQVVVLTAADLREAVRRECPAGVRVLGEPVGRNTAPAIGAAAVLFGSQSSDPTFAVMPSDHAIEDVNAFAEDFKRAFEIAEREPVMLTFGIPPTSPDTNFGYIKRGDKLGPRLFRVSAFTEKPDLQRAEVWVKGGDHSWNSGMFVWRCSTLLNALQAGRPKIAGPLRALKWNDGDAGFERALEDVFADLESVSVDYAVLEHAPNTLVLEASFDWDDLGSWGAWARRQPKDDRGNVLHGDAVAIDCDGCVVVGESGTAAAVGLRDMLVVHANGATVSLPFAATERVREVSDAVKKRSRT